MRNWRSVGLTTMIPVALTVAGLWGSDGQTEGWAVVTAQSESSRSEEGGYADGIYSATGQYGGQPSSITVTVTLSNGVITDVKVTPNAYVPESLEFQQRFATAVPRVVVGKRIDQVKVGKLAGSSGTPIGFNAALDQIRRQAAN